MRKRFDVIVIGGGLLGSFSARSLTKYRLKTAVLEAREDLCTGITRANTAIVYSGCDTKPGTRKSRMCVRAAQSFSQLCEELGVRYSACGSIMICFGPKGEKALRRKYDQGLENGVRGLKLLSQREVLELEPHLHPAVRAALLAPEAGTVIPWELGIAAAENAVANGAELLLNTKVTGIRRTENGYVITSDDQEFFARAVVNCAGLSADRILEAVQKPCVRIFPEAGDYYVLDTKAGGMIRHVIFHEPEEKEKGLTLVPTVDGNILLGPTKVSASGLEAFAVSREGLKELAALVPRVIPDLPMEHVIRSFGAVRPNPFRVAYDAESGTYVTQEESISDFTVHESGEAPGFLSFVGIKTPGLTCAAALGEYAAERISLLLHAEPKETFNPMRAMPLRLNTLSPEEAAKLAAENPAYGRIVCRCRKVTEGEIVDSIRRFPGAVTVDGVKRRTGACSGRCQGSYCTQKIIEIIARERGIPPSSVQKDGPGSYLIGGGIHDSL